MNRIFILMVAVLAAACAKRETEDTTGLEQEALDAWMAKYNSGVIRQSNGVFVEVIDAGEGDLSGVDTITWMKVDYTSTDINGNVFATRDSMEALRQRTFSPHTNYTPDYIYCATTNTALSKGLRSVLTGEVTTANGKVKLKTGAHVKIYVPSYLAYGSGTYTNDQGYGGQYPLGSNKILIQDLHIRDIIKNPLKHEENEVKQFAMNEWGVGELDTLAPGLFVDSTRFAGYPKLFENQEWIPEFGLTVDSTATVWYVGRFMPTEGYPDGFIFDTNVDSLYNLFYGRRKNDNYPAQTKTFSALSYKASSDKDKYISAWYKAIPKMRRGMWYRIILPSSYGYGGVGMSKAIKKRIQDYNKQVQNYYYNNTYNSNYYGSYNYYNSNNNYYNNNDDNEDEGTVMTEVLPYTPLIFEIYIEPRESDEE